MHFPDAIDHQIRLQVGDGTSRIIRFTHTTQVKHTLRLDRFVVYAIKKFERDSRLLLPDEPEARLRPKRWHYSLELVGGGRWAAALSAVRRGACCALIASDVSSWDEELCLFSGESALIYYPLVGGGLAYVGVLAGA